MPESGVGIGPHFLNFLTVGIAAACSQEERIRSNNKTRAEGTVTGASLKTCPRQFIHWQRFWNLVRENVA